MNMDLSKICVTWISYVIQTLNNYLPNAKSAQVQMDLFFSEEPLIHLSGGNWHLNCEHPYYLCTNVVSWQSTG